jgi:hypothetical protein
MKNSKRSVLLFFIVVCQQLNAQNWKFIENLNGRNVVTTFIESYDKGFIIPLITDNNNFVNNITLIKLDVNGQLHWKIEIGDGESSLDVISIIELKEGGYILGGTTNKLDNQSYDPFILRLNACMEPEWFRVFKETEQDNRLDEIIEYKGQYLLAFSYLKSNFITLALMDKTGHINKNLTLDSIHSEKIRISDKGQIRLIANVGVFGLFSNPYIGIDKSVVYEIDSNLLITKTKYLKLNDTMFPSLSFDLCYIGENREDFLSLSSHREPNPFNKSIDGSVMITRNLENTEWYKIINDTSTYNSGVNMIYIGNNRYAISSVFSEDPKGRPWDFVGMNYIIDSNANIIHSTIENTGYRVSRTGAIIRTSEGKIMTAGAFSNNQKDYSLFCYQYNQDLSFAQKSGVVRRYDSLCPHAVVSQKIALPDPEVYLMDEDQFVFIEFVPGITRNHFVYPNPSPEKKYHFNQTVYDEVEVYNASGVLTKSLKATAKGLSEIDLSELQSGIYFIMIKGMLPIKVVVE